MWLDVEIHHLRLIMYYRKNLLTNEGFVSAVAGATLDDEISTSNHIAMHCH